LKVSDLISIGGSGKTLMAKRIAEILRVPFSMNDATTFTQAGYIGDDVEQCVSRLLQNAKFDVKKAEIGIVFIDEIDKITKRTENFAHSTSRDVAGEGVQQAMLKMLEGTTVYVPENNSKKGESVAIDTTNILFILSGAFVGLDKVIQDRKKTTHSIGFGAKIKDKSFCEPTSHATLDLSEANESDLIRYGLIPEFVGRIPLVVSVKRLTETELVRILKEPKNSLVEQYTKLFESWNVDLEFTEQSLHTIAKRVMDRQTGARGLKFVMEEILKEPMYFSPCSNIDRVVIGDDLSPTYETDEGSFSVVDDLLLSHKSVELSPIQQ
jgi:ATP-dependent Clp protease ATP-binding subunit ClpX